MALETQLLHIPVGDGGLGEHVATDVLDVPLLADASNVIFSKHGHIAKRRGAKAATGVSLPTDTTGVNSVHSRVGNPVLYSRRGVYEYASGHTTWARAASRNCGPVEISREAVVAANGITANLDMATDGSVFVDVWSQGATLDVYYQVREATTNVVLQKPAFTGVSGCPRVVLCGSTFQVFVVGTATPDALKHFTIHPTTFALGTVTTPIAAAQHFDVVCEDNTNIYLAFTPNASTTAPEVHLYNSALVLQAARTMITDGARNGIAVTHAPGVSRVYVSVAGHSLVYLPEDLSAHTLVEAWGYAGRRTSIVAEVGPTDDVIVLTSVQTAAGGGWGSEVYTAIRRFDKDLAQIGDVGIVPSCLLTSRAIVPPGWHVPVFTAQLCQLIDSSRAGVQAGTLLITLDDEELALAEEGYSTNVTNAPVVLLRYNDDVAADHLNCKLGPVGAGVFDVDGFLVRPVLVGSALLFGHNTTVEVTAGRASDTVLWGTSRTAADVSRVETRPGAVSGLALGRVTVLGTNLLSTYDGEDLLEVTPHFAPRLFGGFISSGGALQVGKYAFRVVLASVDGANNKHRSAPSIDPDSLHGGVSVTIVSPNQRLMLRYSKPEATAIRVPSGRAWYVQVYMTELDSSGPFHLIQEEPITDAASFPKTMGEVTVAGNSDSVIRGLPLLYTTGGILPNYAPPPALAVAVAPSRVWIIDAQNRSTLRASKILEQGIAPEWNAALALTSPLGDDFTALAVLDEKIIAFSESNVYVVSGEGPDNRGIGAWAGPSVLATDTGCVDHRAVASTQAGLFFRGKDGFYLLDRGLNVTRVGNVEDRVAAATVLGAAEFPKEQELRWLLDNDECVVYNYEKKAWSTRPAYALDIANVNGVMYQAKNTAGGYAVLYDRDADDPSYADAGTLSDQSPILNAMDLTTAWIKPGGLQGYVGVKRLILKGHHYTGDLRIRVGYDYDPAWVDDITIPSATLGGSGNEFSQALQLSHRKCGSLRVRLTEVPPVVGVNGAGFTLESVALNVALKPGHAKPVSRLV